MTAHSSFHTFLLGGGVVVSFSSAEEPQNSSISICSLAAFGKAEGSLVFFRLFCFVLIYIYMYKFCSFSKGFPSVPSGLI